MRPSIRRLALINYSFDGRFVSTAKLWCGQRLSEEFGTQDVISIKCYAITAEDIPPSFAFIYPGLWVLACDDGKCNVG